MSLSRMSTFPYCVECMIFKFWYGVSFSYTTLSKSYSTHILAVFGKYRSIVAHRLTSGKLS